MLIEMNKICGKYKLLIIGVGSYDYYDISNLTFSLHCKHIFLVLEPVLHLS